VLASLLHHGPPLCIGIVVGIYWARVVRLVRKTRKLTGHGANLLPPEPIGRALRILWFPTVIAWIVIPLLVSLVHRDTWILRALWDLPALRWLAVIVAIAALGATMICWKRMGKSWRMGIDPNEKTQLVVTGPYAHVRHPIYALQSLLLVASFIAVPNIVMLAVMLLGMILLQWEARREERYLLRVHGAQYQDYLGRAGRFIPKVPTRRKTT
jgi:protein-S-isoprenylcysteine O-methyltransferase Ste14